MLAAPGEHLLLGHMALGQSTFSHLGSLPPLSSNREVGRLEWDMIPENTAKDDLGGGEASERIGTVTVEEKSSGHLVTVETAVWTQIVHDHSFCTLDTHLGSFV